MKKALRVILYIVVFLAAMELASALGSGLRVLVGILAGQHGKPSFVTPEFQVYGFVFDILFIIAYLLIGRKIPIKNRILRGLLFAFFFWVTDYFPQVMGMIGGESVFLDPEAMSLQTVLVDSVGYLLRGAVLGIFLLPGVKFKDLAFGAQQQFIVLKPVRKKSLIYAALLSMVQFPLLLGIFEAIAGAIWSEMYCVNSFGITTDTQKSFYIVFYLFQAVSGLTMVFFYRYSEYNVKNSWSSFATAYGFLLWLPVVLIVMLFGVNYMATIVWGVMMVAAIYADTWVYTRFLRDK